MVDKLKPRMIERMGAKNGRQTRTKNGKQTRAKNDRHNGARIVEWLTEW